MIYYIGVGNLYNIMCNNTNFKRSADLTIEEKINNIKSIDRPDELIDYRSDNGKVIATAWKNPDDSISMYIHDDDSSDNYRRDPNSEHTSNEYDNQLDSYIMELRY